MNPLIEIFWQRYRRSARARILAGFLIGGAIGVSASLSETHELRMVAIWSGVTAMIGAIAALLLESRDKQRAVTPGWQGRVETTGSKIRRAHLEVPPPLAKELATAHEENRFTPMVWFGVALGLVCALCGVLVGILKIVNFFRQ